MTIRQVGTTGIKLVGVYFGASGLVGVATLLGSFATPRMEGLPSTQDLLAANAMPVIGTLGVAAACLFGADQLARLFENEDTGLGTLSHLNLLEVGLVLLGVSTALGGVPTLLQFVGTALWYAEGSRQSMFAARMERSWEPLINAVLEILIGAALAAAAGRLSAFLTTKPLAGRPNQ